MRERASERASERERDRQTDIERGRERTRKRGGGGRIGKSWTFFLTGIMRLKEGRSLHIFICV